MRVDGLMRNKVKNTRDRWLDIFRYVLEHEILMGSGFMSSIDGSVYMYMGQEREIFSLPPLRRGGDQLFAYLNAMYGLSATEPLGKFVYSNLRDHAVTHAPRIELRRFAVFNRLEKTVYLSGYNGQMWRLDGGTPTKINNGDDDVFFADDDGGVACEPDVGPHGMLLDTLTDINFAEVGLGGITPIQQRRAMIVWMFMLAFPDLMPTKPLLMVEGPPGSGKTAAIQLLQFALQGASKPMILSKKRGDDFGVMLLRSPIAMFDNTDDFIDWIPDAICSYTTQGTWTKRKLYSDSDEVVIKPHAFVAVAAKNPTSFRREDTADRCIVLRMERREGFQPMEKLTGAILAQRPQLFGEYMHYVNEIVGYLRVHGLDTTREESTRMADFATFSRAVAAVLRWPNDAVDDLMEAIAAERDAFIREEDPLSDLLAIWLKTSRNIGREVKISTLFDELVTVAESNKITFYKQARTLAQKLRSPHIEREFIVQQNVVDSRKTYQFWRTDDARLTVLQGGKADDPPEGGIFIGG